jgi:general secretion pathway protein F/type IV pilus assembly protein PilC
MAEFAYKARNHAGSDVTGTITAGSRREALCALGDRKLFPLSVEGAAAPRMQWQRKRKIKTQLLATTLTQMADLLQSGVPLLRSLDVLAEQALHPGLTEVLTDVRNQVAEGAPLDTAMSRHPHVFSELTISMVRAGSEGAFLEDALKRTADFLEKQEELRGRIVGAMTYPAILAGTGFVITVVLIVFFVPKFSELFARKSRGGYPLPP